MSAYSQFIFGTVFGNSFVRDNGDGTQTQFFYTPDGTITTREYSMVRELANLPSGDPDDLIRTFQYNVNWDNVMDYAFATGSDYHTEVIDILGGEDDDKTYNGYNHYIAAGAGNDIINAGDGQNQVYGGEGDDWLGAGEHSDIILGNMGEDHLFGSSGQDYVFGGADNDYVSGGPGADVLSGGAGDDEIRGGTGNDIIFDLVGNNDIHGEAGEDFIISGAGDDVIDGNQGSDIIYAGEGNDVINGGSDLEYLLNEAGQVIGTAANGDDIIDAGGGNDRVTTQAGEDVVYGGLGDDYITGTRAGYDGDDIFYGGAGSDELKGRNGNDWLYADDPQGWTDPFGSVGHDKLRGGLDNDHLFGGDGRDVLYGEEGNDVLVGRFYGQSIMTGGDGADTFAFDGIPMGKAHQIKDFSFAEDVLNISDILEGYDALTSDINDFVQLAFRDAGRTDIKVNADGLGGGWVSVASVLADFTGVSVDDLLGGGQLVADQKLFGSDT